MVLKAILFLMLLTAPTASAQIAPVDEDRTGSATKTPPKYTNADTARAIHNLFKSKRIIGSLLIGGSAFVTTLTGVGTLASNNGKNCGGYFCPDAAGSALIIGIGTAPAWIPGSISLIRFNKRREMTEITKYEKTRKLPDYLRRRLAVKFLNTDYKF
jgi:hypothetical protein